MISSRHRFIFIHIPRTGGNSVQHALLQYSDDLKITDAMRDGRERFEIRGPVTPAKHATLQDYFDRLGPAFGDYRVIATLREPSDRAFSRYFSPLRQIASGQDKDDFLTFNFREFKSVAEDLLPAADFLRVNGKVRLPDFTLLYDRLAQDLSAAMAGLGLPPVSLPKVNSGIERNNERLQRLAQAPEIQALIRSRFAEDYSLIAAERARRRQRTL